MGLALDEPNDRDHRVCQDDLRFVIGPELRIWFAFGRTVHVDYDRWTDGFPVHLSGARGC